MKKNKMLRLASVLLILVMLTTSIVGGTFAKYTTTGSASDTARVAKWGVVINTSGSLYSNAYAEATVNPGGNLPAAWSDRSDATKITVAAETETDNIVAPGTQSHGEGLNFSISGKPEVAVTLTAKITAEDIYLVKGIYGVLYEAAVSDVESLKKVMAEHPDSVYSSTGSTYSKVTAAPDTFDTSVKYYVLTDKVEIGEGGYYPVVYTLTGATEYAENDPKTATKAAELVAGALGVTETTGATETNAVVTYASTQKLPANTDLGKAEGASGLKGENLKWEWKFDDDTNSGSNDTKDTFLGNLIAARGQTVDHEFVSIDAAGAATKLTFGTGSDYTVKSDGTIVGNLNTQFSIELTVTQID